MTMLAIQPNTQPTNKAAGFNFEIKQNVRSKVKPYLRAVIDDMSDKVFGELCHSCHNQPSLIEAHLEALNELYN